MDRKYKDHDRKKIVRNSWNAPVLRILSEEWDRKYLYLGLPGPEVEDIKDWQQLIKFVIAFEFDKEDRKDLIRLKENLTLMDIDHVVFCGPMESTIIDCEDMDGNEFDPDEFITLFNMDFTNAITGMIQDINGSYRRRRYELFREISSFQKDLYHDSKWDRFILLLTIDNQFHNYEMKKFINSDGLLPEVSSYVNLIKKDSVRVKGELFNNTNLLKVFVFNFIRDCFNGNNIKTTFCPVLKYRKEESKYTLLHFMIICEIGDEKDIATQNTQSIGNFLGLRNLVLDEDKILVDKGTPLGKKSLTDPLDLLKLFKFID